MAHSESALRNTECQDKWRARFHVFLTRFRPDPADLQLSGLIRGVAGALLRILFAMLAAVTGVGMWRLVFAHETSGLLILVTVIHMVILVIAISRLIKTAGLLGRIDRVMKLALSYIIWFGVIPLSVYLQA